MVKTHLRVDRPDYKYMGQTLYEFRHQSACGYVRKNVTRSQDAVDCFYCLRSEEMKHYHLINKTLTDSQGCY